MNIYIYGLRELCPPPPFPVSAPPPPLGSGTRSGAFCAGPGALCASKCLILARVTALSIPFSGRALRPSSRIFALLYAPPCVCTANLYHAMAHCARRALCVHRLVYVPPCVCTAFYNMPIVSTIGRQCVHGAGSVYRLHATIPLIHG